MIDATIGSADFQRWLKLTQEMDSPELTEQREERLVERINEIEDELTESEQEAWWDAGAKASAWERFAQSSGGSASAGIPAGYLG
jgi:hypothetical protein